MAQRSTTPSKSASSKAAIRATPSNKTKPVASRSDESAPGRGLFNVLSVLLFVVSIGVGLRYLDAYVERAVVYPSKPPTIVLANRPPWMGDFLAEQIIRTARPIGMHSAFDHQMLVDTAELLSHNPWIRDVRQIRREYTNEPGDTLLIDCDYRAPIALVHWGEYYWLVDGDGFKLPESYTADQLNRIIPGADGRTNIRIIEGVGHPPVATGSKWPGDDLSAGIALVKLLYGQDYAEAIRTVDVRNFAGRVDPREAQLVLLTTDNTQIRWGRAPGDDDYFIEVPVARKLQRLKAALDQYGRVDAGQKWIDIRFDKPTTAIPETASAGN